MSESALIGIDLGKHTFHLHGQDKSGREVFRKKCSRAQMMQFFGNVPIFVPANQDRSRCSSLRMTVWSGEAAGDSIRFHRQ